MYAVTEEDVIFNTFLLQAQAWPTALASKRPRAHFKGENVQLKITVSHFGERETFNTIYINSALICGQSSR